jgi:hypothetical protein
MMAKTQQDFSEKEVMSEQQYLVGEDNVEHFPTGIGEEYTEA